MIEAAPVRELGVKFEKRQSMLPTLTLEDATYQASSYDVLADVSCFFRSILVADGFNNNEPEPSP